MITPPCAPTEQAEAPTITYLVDGVPAPFPKPPPPQPDYTELIMAHIAAKTPPIIEGLEQVTGIPDRCSRSASGKLMCASMTGAFRDSHMKYLAELAFMPTAPANARIYQEKGGTGHSYYRMRCRNKGSSLSVYLGKPPDDVLTWMRAILDENRQRSESNHRHKPHDLDVQRIKHLRQLFKRVQVQAHRIAKAAGYRFKGYRLMKVKA